MRRAPLSSNALQLPASPSASAGLQIVRGRQTVVRHGIFFTVIGKHRRSVYQQLDGEIILAAECKCVVQWPEEGGPFGLSFEIVRKLRSTSTNWLCGGAMTLLTEQTPSTSVSSEDGGAKSAPVAVLDIPDLDSARVLIALQWTEFCYACERLCTFAAVGVCPEGLNVECTGCGVPKVKHFSRVNSEVV